MRLHRLLGGRRLSWIRRRCHRQLRRPEFPRAEHRGVGGVTPPLGLLAARYAAQARGEAGVKITAGGLLPSVDLLRGRSGKSQTEYRVCFTTIWEAEK